MATTVLTGTNTSDIDHLRQGIYANIPAKFVPIDDTSGLDRQPVYLRVLPRSLIPVLGPELGSPFMTQTTFGQPKEIVSGSFSDRSKLHPVVYINDATEELSPIETNIELNNPYQLDGAIEPLEIRSVLARTNIDSPVVIKSIKGEVMVGNADSKGRSSPVMQMYTVATGSVTVPFDDVIENNLGKMTLSISTETSVLQPFDDTLSQSERNSRFDVTLNGTLANTVLLSSGSQIDDIVPLGYKSAGAGFTYANNVPGTDSIAFGGTKR